MKRCLLLLVLIISSLNPLLSYMSKFENSNPNSDFEIPIQRIDEISASPAGFPLSERNFSQIDFVIINKTSDWVIDSEELYNDSTIHVYGNITIEDGGDLSFQNITLYFMTNFSHIVSVTGGSRFQINNSHISIHENVTGRWALSVNVNSNLFMYNSILSTMGISGDNQNLRGISITQSQATIRNLTLSDSIVGFALNLSTGFSITQSEISDIEKLMAVTDSQNITINSNTRITQLTQRGIQLDNVSGFELTETSISSPSSGSKGIVIADSDNIKISLCNISAGIQINDSRSVVLSHNQIIDPNTNEEGDDIGIHFTNVNHSLIQSNLISGQEFGTTPIGGHQYGISLENGVNITVINNEIRTFQGWGFKCDGVIGINISGNIIQRGDTNTYLDEEWHTLSGGIGLYLAASSGVEIVTNNTILDLPIGIYFNNESVSETEYENTYIYLNNFENDNDTLEPNLISSMSRNWNYSVQIWNDTFRQAGNFWANYTDGNDSNQDFIIDNPYNITTTVYDYFPLLYRNDVPLLTSVTSHDFFIANQHDQNISWTIVDEDSQTYLIKENNTILSSGLLNSTQVINNFISSFTGNYTYLCIISDFWKNVRSVSLKIIVEPPDYDAPVLDHPTNITLFEVEPKKEITWNCTERYPKNYDITLNQTISSSELSKGEWNSINLTFSLGNLYEGNYSLNIALIDLLGNNQSFLIDVFVFDTGAFIQGEKELNASQDSFVDIFWEIYDQETPILFNVYRNSTKVSTNDSSIVQTYRKDFVEIGIRLRYRFLTNSSLIGLGLYNYTIEINNTVDAFTTFVTVSDTINPTISAHENNTAEIDELSIEEIIFKWNCSDINPVSYNLSLYSFENGSSTSLYATHDVALNNSWNGQNLNYSLYINAFPTNLTLGDYRFIVSATDAGNNTGTALGGRFSIIDNTSIGGPFNPPMNSTFEYDDIFCTNISWNFTDRNPSNVSFFINGTYQSTDAWNGGIIEVNLSKLIWTNETDLVERLAYYEILIYVTDVGDNSNNHTVGIRVQDTIKPKIEPVPSNKSTYIHSSLEDQFSFYVNESLPNEYFISIDGNMKILQKYNQTFNISYNIFPTGTSLLNITLTDLSGNTQEYLIELTILDNDLPNLLNVEANRTFEYPNTRTTLTWNVFDIRPDFYVLYINSSIYESGNWTNRIYILVDLDIGTNLIELQVFDTSNNIEKDIFVISIIDSEAPVIYYFEPSASVILQVGQNLDISILAQDISPDIYTVTVDGKLVISDTWVNEIVIKLENLSVGTHVIKVMLFDQSHNSASQEMRVDVVLTTTLTVEQVNNFFGLDSRSVSFLIFILSITGIIMGVRRFRGYRRRKS